MERESCRTFSPAITLARPTSNSLAHLPPLSRSIIFKQSLIMAHQLPHDLYLVITFSSLQAALTSTSYLDSISAAARTSNALLILVKFATDQVFAPSSLSDSAGSATASGSASSSAPHPAGSSSASAIPPGSDDLPTALSHFSQLQSFLARVYSAAAREFVAQGRPLARVEVVVDELRRLPFCFHTGVEVRRIDVDEEEGVTRSGKGVSGRHRVDLSGGHAAMSRRELYDVAALGGTFDHLHAGHRILLTLAALITKDDGRLIVGVSGEFTSTLLHAQVSC